MVVALETIRFNEGRVTSASTLLLLPAVGEALEGVPLRDRTPSEGEAECGGITLPSEKDEGNRGEGGRCSGWTGAGEAVREIEEEEPSAPCQPEEAPAGMAAVAR